MLLALSFPKYGHPAFAWIALTPLLVALASRARITGRRALSLRRAFLTRFQLGMFDPAEKVRWAQIPYKVNQSPEHDALAGMLVGC